MKIQIVSGFIIFLYSTVYLTLIVKSYESNDGEIDHFFGDVPFSAFLSNRPSKSRGGFQFFLLNETTVNSLTCIKDYVYREKQMHWKIVIKSSRLPPPSHLQGSVKADNVRGFSGKMFVTYLNSSSSNEEEKRLLNIINKLDEFNKGLTENFKVNEVRGDPMTRLTQMQILVSKNSEGKGPLIQGTYSGLSDTKRTLAFECYEKALHELIKMTDLGVWPEKK